MTYSPASVAIVDYGNSSSNPYYLSNGSWVGNGMAHWPPPYSGSANAQSQITATFTWQSSGPTDPPPPAVIVEEDAQASWNAAGQYDSATCADGLGDAQVISYSGGSSSGLRYTVQQNPGSSFSVNCTPTAQIAGSAPHYGYGGISVSYKAIATLVTVNVNGLTDNTKVLIGQRLSASLSTGGYPQSNWQWSVAGADPFAGFQVTATTGQALELTAAMKQQATFSYYYRSLGGGQGSTQSTITCSATITDPKGAQHQVTGTSQINVYEPAHTFVPTPGTVQVWPIVGGTHWLEPLNTLPNARGITWKGSASTPSPFIGEEGAGQWAFAQIITPTLSYRDAGGTIHTFPQNGQTGLDGQFPYNPPVAADGTLNETGDTPGIQVDGLLGADMAGTFQTYMLYQPPDATGASGTTWVPLHELDWNWHGAANFINNAWALLIHDGVTITKNSPVSTLPTWTQVITVGPF